MEGLAPTPTNVAHRTVDIIDTYANFMLEFGSRTLSRVRNNKTTLVAGLAA